MHHVAAVHDDRRVLTDVGAEFVASAADAGRVTDQRTGCRKAIDVLDAQRFAFIVEARHDEIAVVRVIRADQHLVCGQRERCIPAELAGLDRRQRGAITSDRAAHWSGHAVGIGEHCNLAFGAGRLADAGEASVRVEIADRPFVTAAAARSGRQTPLADTRAAVGAICVAGAGLRARFTEGVEFVRVTAELATAEVDALLAGDLGAICVAHALDALIGAQADARVARLPGAALFVDAATCLAAIAASVFEAGWAGVRGLARAWEGWN